MTEKLRYIFLFPISVIYGIVAGIRNFLFDKGIFKSTAAGIPTICIGNLTAGGTGKTPHTEYVLSFLQKRYKTAVLSRGYKRRTKGFQLATRDTDAAIIGDEPYQIYQKFPDTIVAVDEKRVHGVCELTSRFPDLELIILDDAFQHRRIKAGFSILLTNYSRLYTRDFMLPSGRLREWKGGSKRADLIVVSKCSADITESEMENIRMEIAPRSTQSVFFSFYQYKNLRAVFPDANREMPALNQNTGILLVAGIVSPQPVMEHLRQYTAQVESLFFPDHHNFTAKNLNAVHKKFKAMNISKKIIVVTEKDAARLLSANNYPAELKPVTYALPVEVKFLEDKDILFTQKTEHYVKENSRNS